MQQQPRAEFFHAFLLLLPIWYRLIMLLVPCTWGEMSEGVEESMTDDLRRIL